MGQYTQFSNNMHLYVNQHEKLIGAMLPMAEVLAHGLLRSRTLCPYEAGVVKPTPLLVGFGGHTQFDNDVQMLLDLRHLPLGGSSYFIRKVAAPLLAACDAMKNNTPDRFAQAHAQLSKMPKDNDWFLAASSWVDRRKTKWEEKQNAGNPSSNRG